MYWPWKSNRVSDISALDSFPYRVFVGGNEVAGFMSVVSPNGPDSCLWLQRGMVVHGTSFFDLIRKDGGDIPEVFVKSIKHGCVAVATGAITKRCSCLNNGWVPEEYRGSNVVWISDLLLMCGAVRYENCFMGVLEDHVG